MATKDKNALSTGIKTTHKLKAVLLALSLATSSLALAQYPERPITMIVPFPPGGVADTVARPVADAMSKALGKSVVIENKGGAGGAIGIGASAHAKPDGYTILLSLSSISILPEADKILGRTPAYRLDQFKPIARITADPTVLVVRADAPWKSAKEFIEAARKNPKSITYGSSGLYGTMHVPMEILSQAAGISLSHIPYTGAGPAVAGLLGNHVQALATGPASVIQQVKAGKVRALAHWGDRPIASMPEVPSLKSLGHNATFIQWSGVFVPADAPADVMQTLKTSLDKIAADPAFAKTIGNTGSPLDYLPADAFAQYWKQDAQGIAATVQKMGKIE